MDNMIAEHEYYNVLPDLIEQAVNETYELVSGGMSWEQEEALLSDTFQHKLINANLKGLTGVDIDLVDVLAHYDDLIWLDEYDILDGIDWLHCTEEREGAVRMTCPYPAIVWVRRKNIFGAKVLNRKGPIGAQFGFRFMCAECALENAEVHGSIKKSLEELMERKVLDESSLLFSGRDDYSDLLEDPAQWNLWDKSKKQLNRAVSKTATYLPVKDCKHHRQPFVFYEYTGDGSENKRTIYATASADRTAPMEGQEEPLMQVWLATSHLNHVSSDIWTQGITIPYMDQPTNRGCPDKKPAIFINWPDMGVMPIDEIRPVVKYVKMMLNNATKSPIEIGCVGAHGRTGTFMALVLIENGYTADEAIKIVRKDYCKHAIETIKQEDMIKEYYLNKT